MNGNASATIGNVAVGGSGAVSGISVTATDNVTSDHPRRLRATAASASASAPRMAFVDLGGTANATSGAHGSVGSGGLTVTADGTHTSP